MVLAKEIEAVKIGEESIRGEIDSLVVDLEQLKTRMSNKDEHMVKIQMLSYLYKTLFYTLLGLILFGIYFKS